LPASVRLEKVSENLGQMCKTENHRGRRRIWGTPRTKGTHEPCGLLKQASLMRSCFREPIEKKWGKAGEERWDQKEEMLARRGYPMSSEVEPQGNRAKGREVGGKSQGGEQICRGAVRTISVGQKKEPPPWENMETQ